MPTLMFFNSKITFDENSPIIIQDVTCFTYHSYQLIHVTEYSKKENKKGASTPETNARWWNSLVFTSTEKKPNFFTSLYALLRFQNSGFSKSQINPHMEDSFLSNFLRQEYF